MARSETGGYAYPRTGFYPVTDGVANEDLAQVFSAATTPQSGMTLRDWFAGHALCGLLAWSPEEGHKQYSPETAALIAYDMADAMIAERGPGGAARRDEPRAPKFDTTITPPGNELFDGLPL